MSPKKLIGGPIALKASGLVVNLTQSLNYGDQLKATQTVNGVTSALSLPMTAGPMLSTLPEPTIDGNNIWGCGVIAPVYNLESGIDVQVFDTASSSPIGKDSTPDDWGSNWDPVLTSKLTAGHQLQAKQLACNGAASKLGPMQTVKTGPSMVPEPVVVNAIVGNDAVTLKGLFTGALVQLFNGTLAKPLNGISAATGSENYFILNAPLAASTKVLPQQSLCQPDTGTTTYPTTNVIPPPVLVGPVCPGSSSVTVRHSTVNAALVLLLDGVPAGYGGAELGDVRINVAPPAVLMTGHKVQIVEYFTNAGSPPPASSNIVSIGCMVHTRQDVSKLTPAQLASLSKGFKVMIQRSFNNPNDPTGLAYQANMHSTLMSSGSCPMGDASNPLWDQCQHYSNLFFPWHRLYLYYFERILRDAAGDPNLTLPYWNYESASEQALPPAFLTPASPCSQVTFGGGGFIYQMGDPSAHPGCNPLYLPLRTLDSGSGFPMGTADDSVAMGPMNIGFEPSMGGNFGGGPPPGPCHFDSAQGELESQPHDVIHTAVGGIMGETTQSANDPIFYLHHTEIDHLWKRWLAKGGGRANPTSDSTWMNTSFTFYDETGNVVTLSVKDALDTVAQLDYRYDDDPQVKGQPMRRAVPATEITEQLAPAPQVEPLTVTAQSGIDLAAEQATAQITVPPETQSRITRLMQDKRSILLSLQIDHVKNKGGVFYEIYLNLRPGEKPVRTSANFVGNLGFFTQWDGAVTKTFNLTHAIQALQDKKAWNGNEISVSFVPRGPVDAKTKRPLPIEPGVRAIIKRIDLSSR